MFLFRSSRLFSYTNITVSAGQRGFRTREAVIGAPFPRSGLRSSPFPLRYCPVLCAKLLHWLTECAFTLPFWLSYSHTTQVVHMHRDAHFHSTRAFALLHRLVTALTQRQRVPVTGQTPGYIPTAALTQQAPGTRGGGRARVHWMRQDDHVREQEKKRKVKRRLVGDCQSKKKYFYEAWAMARKDESAVKRLGSLVGPLFLLQLHSVKLKSLIFYYCREERQCHCESRQKKTWITCVLCCAQRHEERVLQQTFDLELNSNN